VHRDRLTAFLRAAARLQRLSALSRIPELVAAAPTAEAGWDLAVIRHGRLTAAASVPHGVDPRPWVDAVVATAETVRPGPGPTPCASAEETERIERWLEGPGVRLVRLDGQWCWPAAGAARQVRRMAALPQAAAARR
jgi:DNA polymerase-3 subunit epsilon